MAKKIKWVEMTPAELDEAIAECPIAYLPVGSLEWHGPHLPLGTDFYRAEALCLGAARKTGGVVLPGLYVTAPGFAAYRGSITFSPRLVEQIVDEMEREIEKVGFRVLIKLLGHGGQAQAFCFRDTDRRRPRSGRLTTVVAHGSVGRGEFKTLGGPHAGSAETAQCYAIVPKHVQLDKFSPAATTLPRYEGLDPATYYDGLPEEIHDRVRAHIARTEWTWEPDLVERVSDGDVARRMMERAIEVLAEKALAVLKEAKG